MAMEERIKQSHAALKEYFSPSKRHQSSGNPAQLIVFAEHAIKNGCREVALDCVQLYLSLSPPVNQFTVRAHLCEALTSAPHDSSQEDLLSHSLSCILKAVATAKKSECYYFLVYNASVLLWQICRPFQRPGSRRGYTKPLATMLKALEEIKDQDTPWRLELMIGLVLSQLDAGQSDEAAKTCSSAVQLARKKAPQKLGELMRLYVSYNLGDSKMFDRDSRSFPEYGALIQLYKVKSAMVSQKISGPELEQRLRNVFTFITSGDEPSSVRKTASQSCIPAPPLETRPPLLLELGSLAMECGLSQLAGDCLSAVPQDSVGNSAQLMIRRQMLGCQVLVREGYSETAIEGRVDALKRLEGILTSAVRSNDMDLIQHVCVALWNTSLPLLQPNLRHHLLKPLSATATALEQIDSLLHQVRVGIHFELGKIHADQGQLEASLENLGKASGLDCFGKYREQISVVQNKVTLRAQLYTTPEEPLQRAIKTIEQASSLSGGGGELRSLLVKAGELLAPNQFLQTLSSPSNIPVNRLIDQINASSELSSRTLVAVEEKGKKLADYCLAKELVGEHLKSMDKQEDRQRCRVWSDLARAARKQSVWDVAISAARFCVTYDDGRWAGSVTKSKCTISERLSSPRLSQSQRGSISMAPRRSSSFKHDSVLGMAKSRQSVIDIVSIPETLKREECDLVRTLANTHCLLAECLVFYLQQEGLQLGEKPPPLNLPQSLSEAWGSYTSWLSQLSSDSVAGFLRAGELGVVLGEEVIVGNAAVYLWNYHHHWVKSGRLLEVVGAFKPLLDSMKLVKMNSDSVLLIRVCSALVGGVVKKWSRPKPPSGKETPRTGKKGARADSKGGSRAGSRKGKAKAGGDAQLPVDPESVAELKEALEVCEYCLGVWNSSVPLSVRGELLSGWVACRQLLHQPFTNKNFDIEETVDLFAVPCRAMVAVKLLCSQGNGIWDFPNCPTLSEVSGMVSECEWGEVLVEMQLWVRLAELALKQKDHSIAYQCSCKAVTLKLPEITSEKLSSDQRLGCELQSLAYSIQGQALSTSAAGNVSVLRTALGAFYESVRVGHTISSYCLVFDGCRHYWLTCQPLTADPMERHLLQQPLCELLDLCVPLLGGRHGSKNEDKALASKGKDYELVTRMYSIVFQAHIDKCCWEEGLTLVEEALWSTPKPIHPHLVPFKLVFKSRMGKSVTSDFIRFQEEPSEFVASLWHKAAINSSDPTQTITAYQNAIDSLQDGDSWQKIEYLLEFCEWLYTHEFPITDPIDQLEKITEILLSTHDDKQSSGVVAGVRQLEVLIRVHVMMALLHGQGSSEHNQLSVVTVGFCMELWKVLLGTSGLPASMLEWSTYSPPTQLLEQFKASSGDSALNKETVSKPMLTLHYLSELVEALFFNGLHSLALPVLKLQVVIAETLIDQNKPLCQLYHMRLSWLCSELGLPVTPTPFTLPDPEDVANSQMEIEQYQAKKAAVEKEGSKQRNSSSKPRPSKSSRLRSGKSADASQSKPSISVRGRCVGESVVLREVWVDMARLLIQQGAYQLARDLLNQAILSSQIFEDQRTLFIIHILLARLALTDRDQQKAIKLVTQAQKYPADLPDWLEGILLLSDAINSNREYRNQLKAVMEHATSKLDKLRGSQVNNSSRLKHAIVTINTRLVLCELGELVKEVNGSVPSIAALSQALTDSTKALMGLGHIREAACISRQHVSFLRSLAHSRLAESENQFVELMLEAISLCDKAVTALQTVCEHTVTICQPSKDMSLPVQRELVTAQSLLADLLLDTFSHHSAQSRKAQAEMRDKSSMQKLVEDFVKEKPILSLMQEDWQNTIQMALEKALALLTSAHAMVNADNILNIKVMVGLGRCLRLLSTHTRPDSALQWTPECCVVKNSDKPVSEEGDSPELGLSRSKYGALSSVMRSKEAEKAECDESASLLYLTQASHTLVQAVSMSISNKQLDLGIKAALELVDCCGGFDTITASLYLALYQSLSVSIEMEKLLRQILADPSCSKLGALLEQNQHLTSSQSPSQHNIQELQAFEAYKMLTVSDNHLDLLKRFPSHFRFLVLQHSPDGCRLYASYLVPPQPPPPASKKGQPPPIVECLDPVITSAHVSPKDLHSLLDMMSAFEANRFQQLTISNSLLNDSEDLLKDVVAATEAYLSQVMRLMADAFRREKIDRDICVVVLADTHLLRLPLEAMEIFQAKNIRSVTRDFSLQVLCHRLEKFTANEPSPQAESSKDTKKKGDKYQPQPTTFLANTANFRYVLDPRKEFEGSEVCSKVVDQIQQFSKLTSKWSGYNAGEQVLMTVNKWTALFKEASGLIFFGPESLLAHLPPTNLVPLSLRDCSVAVIMDRVHTSQSMVYQSKLDFHKSCFELKCECPVETAILLSLVGVRCLLSNQWTSSVQSNLDNILNTLRGLLSEGITIGELNWSRIRSSFECSSTTSDQNEIDPQNKTSLKSADGGAEVCSEQETTEDAQTVDYSSTYNYVLYGLPHVNLISPSL
ncbi:cilia- and flagella-associated protein 46-like [Halichondria panicea]|uniref:cilia- and flagella-associated protein 46-like n=1 Tax=Halichondria panicea TaxID=6063 RepID=UPI00312B5900